VDESSSPPHAAATSDSNSSSGTNSLDLARINVVSQGGSFPYVRGSRRTVGRGDFSAVA